MWGAIITGVLSLLGKIFGWLTRKDERDVSHDQGERQGVAETQAATDSQTIKQVENGHDVAAQMERNLRTHPDRVREPDANERTD